MPTFPVWKNVPHEPMDPKFHSNHHNLMSSDSLCEHSCFPNFGFNIMTLDDSEISNLAEVFDRNLLPICYVAAEESNCSSQKWTWRIKKSSPKKKYSHQNFSDRSLKCAFTKKKVKDGTTDHRRI